MTAIMAGMKPSTLRIIAFWIVNIACIPWLLLCFAAYYGAGLQLLPAVACLVGFAAVFWWCWPVIQWLSIPKEQRPTGKGLQGPYSREDGTEYYKKV